MGGGSHAHLKTHGLWSVFVDGIREEVSYRVARSFFDRLEGIKGIFIQRPRKVSRRFKFGFLRFGEYEKAYDAIRKLNGFRFHGAFLSLKMEKKHIGSQEERRDNKETRSSKLGTEDIQKEARQRRT